MRKESMSMAEGKVKKTQMSEVLRYLQTHKRGLTQVQAFEKFGVTKLPDIIYKLRKLDWCISAEQITKKNRYGHTTNFHRYYLADTQEKR